MKGDFTRRTFRPEKQYTSVRMQQGRVQLDEDWNEQVELQQLQVRQQARDTFTATGVPAEVAGSFSIGSSGDRLSFSPGRMYVDGILVSFDSEGFVDTQPFFPPGIPEEQKKGGIYLVFMDVWERLITGLEDPDIVDTALGGADTATRVQTIWQIKLRAFANQALAEGFFFDGPPSVPEVRVDASAPPTGNQLYRLEIHQASSDPAKKGTTFKWSRDNGSVVARWEGDIRIAPGSAEVNPVIVTVKGRTRFAAGQIIELTDDSHELSGVSGEMCKIISVKDLPGAQELTVGDAKDSQRDLSDPLTQFTDGTEFGDERRIRKARLWNSAALDIDAGNEITLIDESTGLASGVVVKFSPNAFTVGDAWLIAVRQGTVEAAVRADDGHHFAKLAVVERVIGDGSASFSRKRDLRPIFDPLPKLTQRVNALTAQTTRQRHYHGIADIDANMPLSIFLHFEDDTFIPRRVKLFLHGQQFSSAFYTELGRHTHTASSNATIDLRHTHPGTTNAESEATAHSHDIAAGGRGADSPRRERGFQLEGQDFANYGRTSPPQIRPAPHQHTFTTEPALSANTQISLTLDPTGAAGTQAGTERKLFINRMQFFVDGTDRTGDLSKLVPGGSLGDGTANNQLVRSGTGVLDITPLIPLSRGSHELRFSVAAGGGKLVYDVFCE